MSLLYFFRGARKSCCHPPSCPPERTETRGPLQVAWAAKREAKLAEERALKPPPPEEDMSECTFSPRINPIPRYLASEMGPSEPQTAVKGAGHGYRKSRESWSPARLDVGHRQPEARTSIQEGPGEARGGTRVRPLRAPTPHKTDAAGFAAADNEGRRQNPLPLPGPLSSLQATSGLGFPGEQLRGQSLVQQQQPEGSRNPLGGIAEDCDLMLCSATGG